MLNFSLLPAQARTEVSRETAGMLAVFSLALVQPIDILRGKGAMVPKLFDSDQGMIIVLNFATVKCQFSTQGHLTNLR